MIEKKEESCLQSLSNELTQPSHSAVAKLGESQQRLELECSQIKSEIQATFEKLVDALRYRETQLLRQVDVLQNQKKSLLHSFHSKEGGNGVTPYSIPDINVDLSEEQELLESFVSFGKVNVEGGSLAALDNSSVPYRIEEYQNVNEDHMSFFKPVSSDSDAQDVIKFNMLQKPLSKLSGLSSDGEEKVDLESAVGEKRTSVCSLDCDQHTPHVQQWLQQIMAETETEPCVVEGEKRLTSLDDLD